MVNAIENKKRDLTALHVVISIAIMFVIGMLPPIGTITLVGMKVVGVFLGAIYGWSVSEPIWPSFLAFIALPFTGVISYKELIATGWGSEVVIFLTFCLIFIRYLDASGVSRYIAVWLMSRKVLLGHPWIISFMILLAAFLICSFVKTYVGVFVLWSTVYAISTALGYKPYDKYPTLMILGITLMGCLSLVALPYSGNALVLLGAFTSMTGTEINMGHYMLYTMPMGLLTILAFLLLCRFVFRPDVSRLKNFDPAVLGKKELMMTKQKKIALLSLGAFVLLMLIPGLLPQTFFLARWLQTIGIVGIAFLTLGVLSLIKVDGEHVFELGKCAAQGISWGLVVMPMMILPLGNAMVAEATGIKPFLQTLLAPVFNGLSPFMFLVVIGLIAVILTNFFINVIIGMLLLPIGISFAATLGIPELQITYLIVVCVSIALLTPAASAASVMMFANRDWIMPKDIYFYGTITAIVTTVIAILLNYFWVGIIC